MLPYLDTLSEAARIIGAVNTVVVQEDGSLFGENTDGKGFVQALLDQKMTLKGKNVTILGAGGAARAIAVECALAGASSVLIVNRTEERAIELADVIQKNTSAKALWQKWEGSLRIPSNTDLLVNATSIGLHPDSDSLPPVDYDTIHAGMTVSDVVF